jgi:hypothetical protein
MINTYIKQRTAIGFRQGPIPLDLTKGVNHMWLIGRLSAQVDVAAGGGADGTLITEGIQRFLRSVRVTHSVFKDVVPRISGRDVFRILSISRAAITNAANLAIPGIQAATLVNFDFLIPFAQPWMSQPILSAFPRQATGIGDTFQAEFEFETAVANAGDSPGSAAFVTGGSRVVTISNVSLQIAEVYALTPIVPWGMGAIEVVETEQITAAAPRLELPLRAQRPFTASIARFLAAATGNAGEFIADWTFDTGIETPVDQYDRTMSQREEAGYFPALLTTGQVGQITRRWGDGGYGQALDPGDYGNPKFRFNCTNPGVASNVRALLLGFIERPGLTQRRG